MLSNEASIVRIQLQRDIGNAQGIEAVCNGTAWNQYKEGEAAAQNKFNDCVNGQTPIPTPTTTKATKPDEFPYLDICNLPQCIRKKNVSYLYTPRYCFCDNCICSNMFDGKNFES